MISETSYNSILTYQDKTMILLANRYTDYLITQSVFTVQSQNLHKNAHHSYHKTN